VTGGPSIERHVRARIIFVSIGKDRRTTLTRGTGSDAVQKGERAAFWSVEGMESFIRQEIERKGGVLQATKILNCKGGLFRQGLVASQADLADRSVGEPWAMEGKEPRPNPSPLRFCGATHVALHLTANALGHLNLQNSSEEKRASIVVTRS